MRAFNILGAIVLIAATLAGCKRQTVADVAPPQATDVAPTPKQTSLIAVPIDADAAMLKRALERAVPRTLWTTDRRETECVPTPRSAERRVGKGCVRTCNMRWYPEHYKTQN